MFEIMKYNKTPKKKKKKTPIILYYPDHLSSNLGIRISGGKESTFQETFAEVLKSK